MLCTNLKLRFDQRHDTAARPQKRGKSGKHKPERNKREVDGNQIDSFRKVGGLKHPNVSPLQGDHTRMDTEPRGQLSTPNIKSIDALCPPLQQAIGEAAGRRSDIQGDEARNIDAKGLQGAFKFKPASARIWEPGTTDFDLTGVR
jgi:hypothetical protein